MTAKRLVMLNRLSDLTPDNCDLRDLAKKYHYRRLKGYNRQFLKVSAEDPDLPNQRLDDEQL